MIFVKKLNRVLRINEGDKDRYLKDGWAVIHEGTGKVLEKANSKTENQLEKLTSENKALKAELAKLKKAPAKTEKGGA